MNNAKMWLVVKPTVGVPLFLSAVAVGSFAVHVAVVTNTGWVSDFLQGNELGTTANASLMLDEPDVAKASYVPDGEGQIVTIEMPDGTTMRAVLQPNEVLASAPLQVLD
ncbi:MAG: light-harvesting protein [Pseudomonadota bacterium]